jgi:hypothetical protein
MSKCTSSLMHRRFFRTVAPAALAVGAALASLAWSGSAAASNTVGVDLGYNDALNDGTTDGGAGVDIYFGPRMDLGLVALTTELDLGFHDFGGAVEPRVYRGMAGGRLALGAVIRPSVFAHIGAGHLRWNDFPGLDRDSRTGLATDLGAALDFTVLPLVDLGIQLSYNAIAAGSDEPAFDWMQAGAHVVFVFGS